VEIPGVVAYIGISSGVVDINTRKLSVGLPLRGIEIMHGAVQSGYALLEANVVGC